MTTTLTVQLSNGLTVLAKREGSNLYARVFANRTQAEKAATKVGGFVGRSQGARFLVVIERVDGA